MGSCPTVANNREMNATNNPLSILPSLSMETTLKPKMAIIICSGGPTFNATMANKGANNSNAMAEKNPPKAEANVTVAKASPLLPLRTNALPSKLVGTLAGVPGMPINTAGMEPPYTPPQYTPLSSSMAAAGSRT